MTTKYESAKLILELYDLRREEKMREARSWWFTFKPKNLDDFHAAYKGPDSAKLRMVIGYWDMAAALVNHGAIEESMFFDTNGEFWFTFAKLQPFLADIRKTQPTLLVQLETLIMKMPGAHEKLEKIRTMYG